MEGHNQLLEARMDSLRQALDSLAAVTDENLRTLLLRLTCDKSYDDKKPLQPVGELARQTRERCLLLVARQQPLAHDLKYAMAALRIGHDYERIQELAESLNKRIGRLQGTPIENVLRDMTGVMADILKVHEAVRHTWQRERKDIALPDLKESGAAVHSGISKIQTETVDAISKGFGNSEMLVDLVLACRHLKRIANLMESIPDEQHSFDA
jgi:phosphate transport system protein